MLPLLTALALFALGLVAPLAPLAAQKARRTDPGLVKLVPPVPTPASFVHDGVGVLSSEQRAAIDRRIGAMQAAGRGDVGVALLRSIGDYQPYEVGVAIYRAWRIGRVDTLGSARRDLGALLLIVPKEFAPDHRGQCWITTGLGAEGLLTDAAAGRLCRDAVIPRLKEKDYAGAVEAGIAAIDSVFRTDPGLAGTAADGASEDPRVSGDAGVPGDGGTPWWVWLLGGGGTAGVLGAGGAMLLRWRRRRPRRCKRCGTLMEHALDEQADDAYLSDPQRLEEKLRSVDYDVWRCPSCGATETGRYRRIFTAYHPCPQCRAVTAKTTRRTITEPTTTHGGTAEETTVCASCGYHHTKKVSLPRITTSSGSSGGSSSGGGSSFGGSGATSGGGGGSSY